MYQKDYILRMIEMLGEMIAGILGLIRKGDFKKAEDKLENLYYTMLKEDSAFFRDIPADELTARLLNEHNYTNGHLEVLAELFNFNTCTFIAGPTKENMTIVLSFNEFHFDFRLFITTE